MADYIMTEEFKLPSLGKIYEIQVPPIVKLRSMTTEEEMKRLSPTERPYQKMCEILDDCIVDNIGMSTYDLCVADYQMLLYGLRIVTYGSDYNVISTCSHCASRNEHIIKLDQFPIEEYSGENLHKYLEFELPKTKKRIKLRMQTPRILDDIISLSKERNQKTSNNGGDSAFLFSIQNNIESVDGKRLDIVKIEDFIRSLPMIDTNTIIKKAEKLNESFGVKTDTTHHCSFCGLDYTVPFRITDEFFRPTID
jgi:hypothetical protein